MKLQANAAKWVYKIVPGSLQAGILEEKYWYLFMENHGDQNDKYNIYCCRLIQINIRDC